MLTCGAALGVLFMKFRFRLWHLFAAVAIVGMGIWFALHSDYVLVYTSDNGWRYGRWGEVFKKEPHRSPADSVD